MPVLTEVCPQQVDHHFMPASNSLLVGIMNAAYEDLSLMMKALGNVLLEIWLETVYSTATLIQRFR